MLMSWKLWAAAALVAVGLPVGPPARAGDLFRLALRDNDAPAQTLVLKGDAETVAVAHHGSFGHHVGHHGSVSHHVAHHGSFGHHVGHVGHHGFYGHHAFYRYWPRYGYGLGYGYGYDYGYPSYYYPPVYYYSLPYCYPASLGVETYSLPEGNVNYSITRPGAPAAGGEVLPPPEPRDGTYPYDGGPANPVPMPKADPGPTSAPRHFPNAPLDEIKVSRPSDYKVKEPAKGKFAYPAYGEEPRRGEPTTDRTIIKVEEKNGR
jgi:hypothetical protein